MAEAFLASLCCGFPVITSCGACTMSKRLLAMRRETVRPVFSRGRVLMEGLEGRQLMSAGPAGIANATVNDSVFDADTKTVHVVYYDATAKSLKYQSFDDQGGASAAV